MNPASERDRIIEVLVRVAERSLFAFAEPADPATIAPQIDGGWIEAAVSFHGPFSGHVTLIVSSLLARHLCGAFLGLGPDEPLEDAAVADFVGEFANMVCGSWLTGLDASACFDLAHPQTQALVDAPPADAAAQIDGFPMLLVVRGGGSAA
jgi:CheY-specific phosphatase CheX